MELIAGCIYKSQEDYVLLANQGTEWIRIWIAPGNPLKNGIASQPRDHKQMSDWLLLNGFKAQPDA